MTRPNNSLDRSGGSVFRIKLESYPFKILGSPPGRFYESLGWTLFFVLKENNHPTEVFWVFRDDLWKRSLTEVLVKYPPSSENLVLAQKVFSEGCERGLV